MDQLRGLISALNAQVYNPVGLHIRWPRDVAFLFVRVFFFTFLCVGRTLIFRVGVARDRVLRKSTFSRFTRASARLTLFALK